MKETTGGFRMHDDEELDVRACYTAISVSSVLNILDDKLVPNLRNYIARIDLSSDKVGRVDFRVTDWLVGVIPSGRIQMVNVVVDLVKLPVFLTYWMTSWWQIWEITLQDWCFSGGISKCLQQCSEN